LFRPKAAISAQNSKHRASGHGDELKGMPIVLLVNGKQRGGASRDCVRLFAGFASRHRFSAKKKKKRSAKGSVQSIIPLDDGSALRAYHGEILYTQPQGDS